MWTWLLKDAEQFAGKLIKRYRWRGAKGGVLSGGFDASSIAAQAVTELFQPIEPNTSQTGVDQTFVDDGPGGFVMPGPIKTGVPETDLEALDEEPAVREPDFPKGWESECRKLQEDLYHRVRRQVNRLWHLKERLILHNVDDLAPVQAYDGESTNLLETLPAPDHSPHESLIEQEERASAQRLQEQVHAFLAKERALQSLYACLCAGVSKRQDLARKLKITTGEVHNRLKRLRRQAAAFLRQDRSPGIQNALKKVATQIPHLQPLAEAA